MKKKILFIILSVLIIVSLTACSAESKDTVGTTESTVTIAAESTLAVKSTTEKETTTSETTTQESESSDTTTRPTEQKSAGQTTTKKATAMQRKTTTERQTSAKKQTVTNKPTTTKKQSTTKEKTTVSTTAKSNKLTKNDVEWVQSQAHSYIRSKGCNVNSSVSSFSGRISTKNFTDKNSLLSEVKEWIDSEYDDCIASGWKTVDMYCKIESRSDGNYFIYVMYG